MSEWGLGWRSDVPHAGSDIGRVIAVLRVTQGQQRDGLNRKRGASLRSTITSTTTSSLNSSILASLLELLTTSRACRSLSSLVAASTVGSQVSIVDGRDCGALAVKGEWTWGELTQRHWSGRAHVLVGELVDHLLELIDRDLGLIQEHMIVDRTSSTLDGRVSIEIEVILKWMSDIMLNESTRKRISIAITSLDIVVLREEANVVTLGANSNGPDSVDGSGPSLNDDLLHMLQLLIDHMAVLTLRDTITEVVDVLRSLATTNSRIPLLQKWKQHLLDVVSGDHLHTVSIGLDSSSKAGTFLVKRDSNSSHGALRRARSSVRDIRTNDQSWTIEEWLGSDNLASSSTKLGVDLHADVGAVLWLGLLNMGNVDTWALLEMRQQKV